MLLRFVVLYPFVAGEGYLSTFTTLLAFSPRGISSLSAFSDRLNLSQETPVQKQQTPFKDDLAKRTQEQMKKV